MRLYEDRLLQNKNILFDSVIAEHKNQIKKWDIQTHSLFEWMIYTSGELGSLAKAISEYEYRNGDWEKIYNEAIQVATLSLKIAEMVFMKNKMR